MINNIYCKCKHWLSPQFICGWLIASTITFGPEHFLWEKCWPFYSFSKWLEKINTLPMSVSIIILILWALAIGFLIINFVKSKSKSGLAQNSHIVKPVTLNDWLRTR